MADIKGKKILISGGAGFIGSHLTDALILAGADVVIIDNLSTGRRENVNAKAKFYQLDMNDPAVEKIFIEEKPEILYLLAFNTNVPKSVENPLFDIQSLTGNLQLMTFATKYNIKRIIFSSSGFVYGNTDQFPTPETVSVGVDNPYMISKYAAEHYLQYFHKVSGIPIVIFRYATTYGPRQVAGAMADYIRCIAANKQALMFGDGTKTRDYVFVSDVVAANLLALDFNNKDILPIFNIGTGKETTLNELYGAIARLLKKDGAKPDYRPERQGELMRFSLNSQKAKKYLSWEPKVSLDEGLSQVIKYFLSNK